MQLHAIINYETQYVDAETLGKYHLKQVGTVYIYDKDRGVHCASLTPANELWPVDVYLEFYPSATEQQIEEAEESFREVMGDVIYIEKMDHSRAVLLGTWEPEPDEDPEEFYLRAIEEASDYYRGNPRF